MVRRQISKTYSKNGYEVDLIEAKGIHFSKHSSGIGKFLKRAMRKRESRRAKLELKGIEY